MTDLERTVIDSIKDFEKIGGFEELMNCLSLAHYLDEAKFRAYLDAYRVQVLYQREVYLLDGKRCCVLVGRGEAPWNIHKGVGTGCTKGIIDRRRTWRCPTCLNMIWSI